MSPLAGRRPSQELVDQDAHGGAHLADDVFVRGVLSLLLEERNAAIARRPAEATPVEEEPR